MSNFLQFLLHFKEQQFKLKDVIIETDEELVVIRSERFKWTHKCHTDEDAQMFAGYLLFLRSVPKNIQNVLMNLSSYVELHEMIDSNKYCKVGIINSSIKINEITANEFFNGNY